MKQVRSHGLPVETAFLFKITTEPLRSSYRRDGVAG
jgi:hypothetical protein